MHSSDPLVTTLEAWFAIFRRNMMGNFFSYARDNGLTMGQFGAMLRIHHSGICGVSDIGSILGVTNSAASQMLERLVQLNLISRTEDPVDRRGKQIVLTDKGRLILQGSSQGFHNWLEDLVKTLSAEEQEHISEALSVLIEKTSQLEKSST